MFYGGFLLFEAVRPRNLAAGTEKSEPRKRNSRPRNSFFEPRFFQTAAWKPFFPLFGTFSPTNPRCQYVGTSLVRLTCPGNPGAETAVPATKRKPAPSICRHLGFRTFRETAFFAPATAPCPVQVNLRGLQMTKCQIPRKIAKCQIRRNVSAGKQPLLPSEQQRGKTVEALPPHGPRVPTRHFEIGVFDADFVETSQHGLAIPIGNVLLPAH